MRRRDREVTDAGMIDAIINECEIMRLGLSESGSPYPYIVPVNFAPKTENGVLYLYFHGSMAGRKYEMLKKEPRCTFEMDIPIKMECIPEKRDVTMRYKCVMGKAVAEFLEGEEKQKALDEVIMSRHEETKDFDYNREAVKRTAVIRLRVTELTAKANLG